jgi:hypothetical protein
MIVRVLPSALSHPHPCLRLAGPARPLICVEKRGTAGVAARGRRAAPRHSAARLDWADRAVGQSEHARTAQVSLEAGLAGDDVEVDVLKAFRFGEQRHVGLAAADHIPQRGADGSEQWSPRSAASSAVRSSSATV